MKNIKEKLQTGMIAVSNAGEHYMILRDLINNSLNLISNDSSGRINLAFYDDELIFNDKNNESTINMVYIPDIDTVSGFNDFLDAPIKKIIFKRVDKEVLLKTLDYIKKEYNKISIDFKQNHKKTTIDRRQFIEKLDNFDILLDKFSDNIEEYFEK